MIDAHHHVWDLAVRDQPWIEPDWPIRRTFTLADLYGPAEAAGVEATVVVQTVTDPAETPELLALAAAAMPERHQSNAGGQGTANPPQVAGVVGWVDLTRPDVADALAALRAAPGGDRLVGVRHQVQGEPDPRWLCRPDVRRGLRAVGAAGLAYDLLTLPHQLPAAVETVRALPEVRFVLDHLSKPPIASGALEPWAADLRALAAEPHVAAKLSGLVTEADWTAWTVEDLRPYARVALDAFGPARLMFGSDWPVCLLAARSYADVVDAALRLTDDLSPAERTDVFAGTARRWYRLSADTTGADTTGADTTGAAAS